MKWRSDFLLHSGQKPWPSKLSKEQTQNQVSPHPEKHHGGLYPRLLPWGDGAMHTLNHCSPGCMATGVMCRGVQESLRAPFSGLCPSPIVPCPGESPVSLFPSLHGAPRSRETHLWVTCSTPHHSSHCTQDRAALCEEQEAGDDKPGGRAEAGGSPAAGQEQLRKARTQRAVLSSHLQGGRAPTGTMTPLTGTMTPLTGAGRWQAGVRCPR